VADALGREDLAGLVLAGGVAHHRGAAAQHDDRPVAEALEPGHRHHRQQVAHVQAVGGGIEAGVEGEGPRVEGSG